MDTAGLVCLMNGGGDTGKEGDSESPDTTRSLRRTALSRWISCGLLAQGCFTAEWTGVLAQEPHRPGPDPSSAADWLSNSAHGPGFQSHPLLVCQVPKVIVSWVPGPHSNIGGDPHTNKQLSDTSRV